MFASTSLGGISANEARCAHAQLTFFRFGAASLLCGSKTLNKRSGFLDLGLALLNTLPRFLLKLTENHLLKSTSHTRRFPKSHLCSAQPASHKKAAPHPPLPWEGQGDGGGDSADDRAKFTQVFQLLLASSGQCHRVSELADGTRCSTLPQQS